MSPTLDEKEIAMIELVRLEEYCNTLLNIQAYQDYCPNGLQVDAGRERVRKIVSGVTASQALIGAALDAGGDLLLVHHGYFWKNEAAPLTGVKGRRVRALITGGISLLAYHLPLDAHPEFGNNRQLGMRLGLRDAEPMPSEEGLLWKGELPSPECARDLGRRIEDALGRTPLHLSGGRDAVRRIGWCTGAAQGYIERAAAAGLDAFISGEVSEATAHLARELGIHYFAAGHHATERFGVQALGRHLAERFAVEHCYIEIENPV